MSTKEEKELNAIHADLVVLEGMIAVALHGAYKNMDSVLLGNSLEIMKEFLERRTERLDSLLTGGAC